MAQGGAVATADGKAKQLELARVYVDAELESVPRLAPVMDTIAVDTPTLRIAHLADVRPLERIVKLALGGHRQQPRASSLLSIA
nr:hypothetical protein [Rhodoferax sp.]